MAPIVAVLVGLLFAAGIYQILRRSIVKLLLGLMLISHGANMLMLVMTGLRKDAPPIISARLVGPVSDPLPQALILTAIVISFGVTAFTLVLAYRVDQAVGSDDLDELNRTER